MQHRRDLGYSYKTARAALVPVAVSGCSFLGDARPVEVAVKLARVPCTHTVDVLYREEFVLPKVIARSGAVMKSVSYSFLIPDIKRFDISPP